MTVVRTAVLYDTQRKPCLKLKQVAFLSFRDHDDNDGRGFASSCLVDPISSTTTTTLTRPCSTGLLAVVTPMQPLMKTLQLASFLFLPSSLAWVVPGPGYSCWSVTATAESGRRVSSIPSAPSTILPPSGIYDRSLSAKSYDSHESSVSSSSLLLSPQRRRSFLSTVVGSATASSLLLLLAPHATQAATTTSSSSTDPDDLLNQFGLGLSSSSNRNPTSIPSHHQTSSKWPDSPSPLPTNKRSAQELTRETTEDVVPPEVAVGKEKEETDSDLQRALFQSGQRKQIDPRTHG